MAFSSRVSTPLPPLQPYTPSGPLTVGTPRTPAVNTPSRFTALQAANINASLSTTDLASIKNMAKGSKPSTTLIDSHGVYTKDGRVNIEGALENFEFVLSQLIESISKFDPSTKYALDLVEADKQLSQEIENLVEHQEAARQIEDLEAISNELDQQIRDSLRQLGECRKSLVSLPCFREQHDQDENRKVDAKEMLLYATKITKFTSAPPGYNPNMPEHASFPWPTEDELRKGTLAISAMKARDIKNLPKGKPVASKKADVDISKTINTVVSSTTKDNTSNDNNMDKVFISDINSTHAPKPKAGDQAAMLDLDLFDPDEEDFL